LYLHTRRFQREKKKDIPEIKGDIVLDQSHLYESTLGIGKKFIGNYKSEKPLNPFSFFVSNRNGNKIYGHITWILESKINNFSGEIDGDNIQWLEFVSITETRTYVGKILNDTEINGMLSQGETSYNFEMKFSYIDPDNEVFEEENEESKSITLSPSNYEGIFFNMQMPFNFVVNEINESNVFGTVTFPFSDLPLPCTGKIEGDKILITSIGKYKSLITEGTLQKGSTQNFVGSSFYLFNNILVQ